jgi:hypothetical protein
MSNSSDHSMEQEQEYEPSLIELVDLYPIAGFISLASYLLLS